MWSYSKDDGPKDATDEGNTMDDMTIEHWQDPETPGKQGLKLVGSLTIGQAAGFKEALVAALSEASELQVDISGITEIDLTGLQLLGASHRSALDRGKLFRVETGGNQSYLDTVVNAGFRRHVGCAKDVNGTCIWVGGEC
jgi:ABC-type transporter Mla MlaB component